MHRSINRSPENEGRFPAIEKSQVPLINPRKIDILKNEGAVMILESCSTILEGSYSYTKKISNEKDIINTIYEHCNEISFFLYQW